MPRCTECMISFTSVERLHLHYKINHDLKKLTSFRCKESNCYRDYSSWGSFKVHLIRDHFHEDKYLKNCQTRCVAGNVRVSVTQIPGIVNNFEPSIIVQTRAPVTSKIQEKESDSLPITAKCQQSKDLEVSTSSLNLEDSETNRDLNDASSDKNRSNELESLDRKSFGKLESLLQSISDKVKDLLLEICTELYADPNLPRKHVRKSVESMECLVKSIVEGFKD
ncbi:hypothetical protein QAD02_021866 [Eretmocerus hayati]|uniref:Uncharacterized protein n=1 Tax=Eretmocerus hayati TaxID=131215 RepID=A0ACC2PRP6_9HYME|nr:hypothetical protein QAD02_021866 [Eretmocerus hayati]